MKLQYLLLILALQLPQRIYAQNNQWTYFSGNKAINSIAAKGDNIWIGSALGPILLNKSTGEIKHFYTCNCKIPSNYMIDIEPDNEGNIWFATITGLVKFDGTTWTAYDYVDINFPEDFVNCFTIDPDGNKWLGTERGSIVKFNGTSYETYSLPNLPVPPPPPALPVFYSIYDIEFDQYGDKWISTNHGIYQMHGTSFSQNILTSNSGLPDDFIHDIEIDNLGNKWIASNAGLAFFDNSDWQVYRKSNSALPSDTVNCISIDLTNKLWIGTNGGVVNFNGQSWSENFIKYGVPNHVQGIVNDVDQLNWFATDEGLIEFNIFTHNIRRYDFAQTNLGIGKINSIVFGEDNSAWIGGDNGLTKFDGSNWFIFTNRLADPFVSSITAENNNMWIGTHGGLIKQSGNEWNRYDTKNSNLPSEIINSVASFVNEIWAGTENGLAFFNGTDFIVYNIYNSNLPSMNISEVAINSNGDLWMVTKDSYILKFNRENPYQFTIYDNFIGIGRKGPPPPPCLPGLNKTIIKKITFDKDLNTWFATDNGLLRFDGTVWSCIFLFPSDIVDMVFDKNGLQWLASSYYPGLYYLRDDQPGFTFIVNTSMDQPPVTMNFDSRNNLWIGSDQATIGVFNENGVNMDITGSVIDFTGDSITLGQAYLYNTTNLIGGYDTVAGTDVILGKYIFKNVADCGYTVFSEADIAYNNLLPSYLGDTILWMGADTLNVQASTNVKTITLDEKPPALSGKATIIGDVESLLNTGKKDNGTKKRDPIDNAGVAITRKNKNAKGSDMANLVAYAKTDPDGRFEFLNFETKDIEVYDYYIFIDYPGIPMDTINKANKLPITVPGDTLILHASVNPDIIHLTSNIITKVDDITDHSGNLKIFPNPLKVSATFEFPNDGHESYEFKLLNMSGIIVKTIHNITEDTFIMMRDNLDTGVYIFELRGDRKYSGKLLIE